jgi:hypothetical protein
VGKNAEVIFFKISVLGKNFKAARQKVIGIFIEKNSRGKHHFSTARRTKQTVCKNCIFFTYETKAISFLYILPCYMYINDMAQA